MMQRKEYFVFKTVRGVENCSCVYCIPTIHGYNADIERTRMYLQGVLKIKYSFRPNPAAYQLCSCVEGGRSLTVRRSYFSL